tara:strand:+ start:367 stop:678 length:312 start_codon:yes stop_codon:yes gene_type:complete
MAFRGSPGTAVFIDPGQGELKGSSQAQPIAAAVHRLFCGISGRIEGQTHHQALHMAFTAVASQQRQVSFKAAAMQCRQRGHRDAEAIATGQADTTTAHIQAED